MPRTQATRNRHKSVGHRENARRFGKEWRGRAKTCSLTERNRRGIVKGRLMREEKGPKKKESSGGRGGE